MYKPASSACGPQEGRYLMICQENDSGNKNMMGNIFWTRQKIGSSSLERAAETKRATVIVIKSDQHHINETGAQLDLRYKEWKTSRPLKPNLSRTILRDFFRPTAEAEQDKYYILQIHDMICQCTHAVSKEAEIAHRRLVNHYRTILCVFTWSPSWTSSSKNTLGFERICQAHYEKQLSISQCNMARTTKCDL